MFSKIIKIGSALLALSLLLAVIWLYKPLPSNPEASILAAASSNYQVEVIRDMWGVPHIFGKRDADVSYGLAYAHAEDDFETIQETVAATRGVLARYRGKTAAPTDYIVALMQVWKTIEDDYQEKIPEDVKAIAEAYAAGINLYAAQNPAKTWVGLAPFKAEDVVAGFVFKTPFFYGMDKVLLDLYGDSRQAEIALDPSIERGEASWQLRPRSGVELGSNALAVNAERSGENVTRLLINSHQPMVGPVAWYEAHLVSEQGLDITGGLFPGTPVILHGFNRSLGWANTVNHIDLSDTYVLERNPENELQYRLDGTWHDFEVSDVVIDVKLFGPFYYPAKRKVLRSKHGPVIEAAHGSYALRYAGMGEIRQLEQYYRLNQASDLAGFSEAMAMNALPSINYVYADRDDNIGFIHNAQYPDRNDNWDWSKDLPGDRSDLIWQGYHDYNKVPKLINPRSGMLFNANNTPFSATDGPDNIRQSDFPQSMGLASNQTNRSLRFIELNDGSSSIGKAQIMAMKFDTQYSEKSEQIAKLKKIQSLDVSDAPDLAAAVVHLKNWSYSTDQHDKHAALAVLALRRLYRSEIPEDESPEVLRAALQWSVDFLETNHGTIKVAWGEVNRLIRGEINLPLDGGPDNLRAIYSFGLKDESAPYATHGDTWMALVEWDDTGAQTAELVHQFGSATLDKTSPHFADQAPLFANKRWRTALLERDEIIENATRRYSPKNPTGEN